MNFRKTYLLRKQAMYACTFETGGGFFEGECRQETRPLTFCDPPHPGIRELTRASLRASQPSASRAGSILGRVGSTPQQFVSRSSSVR
jgi:hypothetical protein